MIICFEGINRVGKGTQIELLKERLLKENIFSERNIFIHRDPGGTETGEKIREIVKYSKYPQNPVADIHLFSASRALLVDSIRKRPDLYTKNELHIFDRLKASTFAYQISNLESYNYDHGLDIFNFIENINDFSTFNIKIQLTFLIASSKSLLDERKGSTTVEKKDKFEEDDFLRNVCKFYEIYYRRNRLKDSISYFFANNSADFIHNKIYSTFIEKFKTL